MKYDLTSILTTNLIGDDEGLPARLRRQDELLGKIKCIKPSLGNYIMDFEMAVLIDVLNASDEYFYTTFPGLKSFSAEKRREFASAIRDHASLCARCRQKVHNDMEWAKTVDRSIARHRQGISRAVDNETTPEADHLRDRMNFV